MSYDPDQAYSATNPGPIPSSPASSSSAPPVFYMVIEVQRASVCPTEEVAW